MAAAVTLLVALTFGDRPSAAYAAPAAVGHGIPTATPSARVTGQPTSPRPSPSRATAPATRTGSPTATPRPTAPTSTAAPTPHRTSARGDVGPYGRPSSSPPSAIGGAADGGGSNGRVADWTSYLPAPQTGMKIFLAGLIGLAVAITGLATLALRRREY